MFHETQSTSIWTIYGSARITSSDVKSNDFFRKLLVNNFKSFNTYWAASNVVREKTFVLKYHWKSENAVELERWGHIHVNWLNLPPHLYLMSKILWRNIIHQKRRRSAQEVISLYYFWTVSYLYKNLLVYLKILAMELQNITILM